MALTQEQRDRALAKIAQDKAAANPEPSENDMLKSNLQGRIDKMNALEKFGYGAGATIDKGVRRVQEMAASDPAELQSLYDTEAQRRAIDPKSKMVAAGEIGATVIPALVTALATKNTAPLTGLVSMAAQTGTGIAAGNLLRPHASAEEASIGNQALAAGGDALLSQIPAAVGGGYQLARKVANKAGSMIPESAVADFAKRVGGALRNVPNSGSMGHVSAVQKQAREQLGQAVQNAKDTAKQYYHNAIQTAGNSKIQLTNTHSGAKNMPADLAEHITSSVNPVLKRLSSGAEKGSESVIAKPGGGQYETSVDLNDFINARKELSGVKRQLLGGAQPKTGAANAVDGLLSDLDKDIGAWSKLSKSNQSALDEYKKGAQIYRETVVPLTESTSEAGKAFGKGGSLPEAKVDQLLGGKAGESTYNAVTQNPSLAPALRQLHGVNLLEAQGLPLEQSRMLMDKSAIENIYSPEQVDWMRKAGLALRSGSEESPITQGLKHLVQSNPTAVGNGNVLDRIIRGVDPYGRPAFKNTANSYGRAAATVPIVSNVNED